MNKLSYAIGVISANNLLCVKGFSKEDFLQAFDAMINGQKTEISPEEANTMIREYFGQLTNEMHLAEEAKFLAENSKQEGVVSLPSGLQYKILVEGEGRTPVETDTVECHYEGRLITGQVFDSSYARGESIEFNLGSVIPGWAEGLTKMKEGGKAELYIPYRLGYGERGVGPIPPYSTLVFTVELLKVK